MGLGTGGVWRKGGCGVAFAMSICKAILSTADRQRLITWVVFHSCYRLVHGGLKACFCKGFFIHFFVLNLNTPFLPRPFLLLPPKRLQSEVGVSRLRSPLRAPSIDCIWRFDWPPPSKRRCPLAPSNKSCSRHCSVVNALYSQFFSGVY